MDVRKIVEQQIGAYALALIEAQVEIEDLKNKLKKASTANTHQQPQTSSNSDVLDESGFGAGGG